MINKENVGWLAGRLLIIYSLPCPQIKTLLKLPDLKFWKSFKNRTNLSKIVQISTTKDVSTIMNKKYYSGGGGRGGDQDPYHHFKFIPISSFTGSNIFSA